VDSFVNANMTLFRPCPLPNCTNILPNSTISSIKNASNPRRAGAGAAVKLKAVAGLKPAASSAFSTTDSDDVEGSANDGRVVYCAGCRSSICTACEIEEHEGLTCAEYRVENAPPDLLRNKILEDILTLKCPRCKKAFYDFEGCFAIKCSNCPCGFCGWCLKDCGTDAHQHVSNCRKKLNKDTYFGTNKEFNSAMCIKMTADLRVFLSTLDGPQRREDVLRAVEHDLRDLNIRL
jgi:hypothetical protein